MRVGTFLLCVGWCFNLLAQLTIGPLEPVDQSNSLQKNDIRARTSATNATMDIPPVQLPFTPFWDDFSVSDNTIDSIRVWGTDSVLQWDPNESRGVFVNSTLAISPPTFNVATFDGLDGNGGFYSTDANAVGVTDRLVSYPIDLTGAPAVYISFFWQAGGNVEPPELADFLSFGLADTNDNIDTVLWVQTGGPEVNTSQFKQEVIRIPNEYLSDSVVIEFSAFGDLNGPFDAWHLDWIYLNQNRNPGDSIFLDRAITGDLTSPFRPFQSIPTNQLDTMFLRNQTIGSSNLANVPHTNEIGYFLTNTNIDSTFFSDPLRLYTSLQPFTRDTLTLLIGSDTQQDLKDVDFSSIVGFDSVGIETLLEYKSDDENIPGTAVDLQVNDTIRQVYLLHNYYAYDDGTAEYAAGTNVRNGQVAVQFWLDNPDTLTHIDINFPNITPNQNNTSINLNVFTRLDTAGLIRTQQVQVINNASRNSFTRYALSNPVVLSDTFYIGYQQFVSNFLALGFDRSNPEAAQYIFENKNTEDWIQNISLQGALMIRPVFAEGSDIVLSQPEPVSSEIKVYPNPSQGVIRIDGPYDYMELINLSGQVLLQEEARPNHDLNTYDPGIYILRVYHKGIPTAKKIVLK